MDCVKLLVYHYTRSMLAARGEDIAHAGDVSYIPGCVECRYPRIHTPGTLRVKFCTVQLHPVSETKLTNLRPASRFPTLHRIRRQLG